MIYLLIFLFFFTINATKIQLPAEFIITFPAREEPPPPPPPPPTIINNQNANSLLGNASNYFSLDKEAIQNSVISFITKMRSWLYEYRYNIMWGSAALVIGYLCYIHWQANNLMESDSWTCWCLDHDPATISKERMLVAIHQHHLNPNTITNSNLLFAAFLKALEEEKSVLQKAAYLDWVVGTSCIERLLTYRTRTYTQSLRDLEELRIRFSDWFAHQIITKGFYDT